ncbi:MAG: TPMT family class I SAM-dependent methyltransferase [Chitinophagales bacterium]|nr:TPMT family class I SAM-dependent methyltransferase [Chitinophagales bacterium]
MVNNRPNPMVLDQNFWNSRWETGQTGWDIGYPSTPIATFFDTYTNKNAAILIPGCGNAYEAEYLLEKGFTNITLVDIAPAAVERLQNKFKNKPSVKVILGNFFEQEGLYDVIIEQTFFCTLSLDGRNQYVEKCASLLNDNGIIVGVLFNVNFGFDHPPFGGDKNEYLKRFIPLFKIKTMESAYNSIIPRANSELFINLIKK